jgi:Gram-negative bacterial TonB protein C-terminal
MQKERLIEMKQFAKSLLLVGCILAIGTFGSKLYAQLEGGAIAAIDEPAEGGGGSGGGDGGGSKPTIVKKSKTSNVKSKASVDNIRPKTVAARPKPKRWDGFVIGDEYTFMNFEVISAEKPYYTRAAKDGGASGLVQVEILIETNGSVLKVRARTGNKLLHPEAERAALASRFSPFTFGGKPARAIGFLVYRFGSEDPTPRPQPKRYDWESPFKKNK